MKNIRFLLLAFAFSCSDSTGQKGKSPKSNSKLKEPVKPAAVTHYAGALSNGMKGDSIFFDISKDGKRLENLTFKGYWRCSGRLEQTTVGPDGAVPSTGGKVKGHISERPDGGSTAWRFDLQADIQAPKASGTFRMNINNLGCDTYLLQWTATAIK